MPDKLLLDSDGRIQSKTPASIPGVGLDNIAVLAAATVLTSADSGKHFYLNLAGGFTVTLPAVTAAPGMKFKFTVKVAPTTAYIVASAEGDNLAGSVLSSSGGAEDTEAAATADKFNFVANTAVVGDNVEIWGDGQKWYGRAICSATGGITIDG